MFITATSTGASGINVGVNPGGGGNWFGVDGTRTSIYSGPVVYSGFLWGTTDAYNLIEFYSGSTLIGSFTGLDVSPTQTTTYVNFFADPGETWDKVVYTSAFAFEFDNGAFLAAAETPLPAAAALFPAGLGLLGLVMRRRKRSQIA